MVRVASAVTVDASAFFAAHGSAYRLCANGACVTRQAGQPRPAVVFLPVAGAGSLEIRVKITTRKDTVLLRALTTVPVRHVVRNAACADEADVGAVEVTQAGALTSR